MISPEFGLAVLPATLALANLISALQAMMPIRSALFATIFASSVAVCNVVFLIAYSSLVEAEASIGAAVMLVAVGLVHFSAWMVRASRARRLQHLKSGADAAR